MAYNPGMLTTRQVADRLGVSPRRVLALIYAGRLLAHRVVYPVPHYLIDPAALAGFRRRQVGRPRKSEQQISI